ncbi:hypothetical protein [Flavobacterium cyanobacteriorum]|nr:hypothetical protein [Flavobacterium cyanobacteriorum]
MKTIIYVLYFCLLINCKPNNQFLIKTNNDYLECKNKFPKRLVEYLPTKLTNTYCSYVCSEVVSRNDVGLKVNNYNVDISEIDSIATYLQSKSIAKYSSNDTCLLIVNRFETLDSYENREDIIIKDSVKIERDCYKNLYPVPNFIEFRNHSAKELNIGPDFDIYVLEAKSGNYFKEYNLKPNPQMPNNWKNGYSKGVALSREENTVIYWAIVW